MRDETLDAIGIEPRSSNAIIVGLVISTFICGTLAGLYFSSQPRLKKLLQSEPLAETKTDQPRKRKSAIRTEDKAARTSLAGEARKSDSRPVTASKPKNSGKARQQSVKLDKAKRSPSLAAKSSNKKLASISTKSSPTVKDKGYFFISPPKPLAARSKPPELARPKPPALLDPARVSLKRSSQAPPETVPRPAPSAYVEVKLSKDDLQPGTVITNRKQFVIDDSVEEIVSR